jgi:hypothetical protein
MIKVIMIAIILTIVYLLANCAHLRPEQGRCTQFHYDSAGLIVGWTQYECE